MSSFWLTLLTNIAVEFLKWSSAQWSKQAEKSKEAADKKKSDGDRDLRNEQKYDQAKARADQIKAALDIINRNN